MINDYIPEIGIRISEIQINWGAERNKVRQIVSGQFEQNNRITDLSNYHGGNHDLDIHSRRDIYEKMNETSCLIFFNYDRNDFLESIEMHNGVSVKVKNVILEFDKNIYLLMEELLSISDELETEEESDFFFRQLKLVIVSNKPMGGEGDELDYVYISRDVSHLKKPK